MTQLSLFNTHQFTLTKPIKLIELFSGYGSQMLAMKYLGMNAEHFRICEWAVPSIEAYNDIHVRDFTDYSHGKTIDEVVQFLVDKGISSDYNKPMTLKEIRRRPEAWARRAYNNIIATGDTVDITKTHGRDFRLRERERVQVVMTYSFPCQDLSCAGDQRGMEEGSNTRSSMLWEVGRILREMKDMGQLPDVLIMENVPQVCGGKNIGAFKKWLSVLEDLGYNSDYRILSATGFGIPQTRKRCFMVSVPRGYHYKFPEEQPLKVKLKDMLENEVDGKYYLTASDISQIVNWKSNQNPITKSSAMKGNVCQSITAKSNTTKNYNMLLVSADRHVRETIEKNTFADEPMGIDLFNRKLKRECPTLTMPNHNNTALWNGKEVRKLTPRECFRLMGVRDEDSDRVQLSDMMKYHLAGDSIVVNVLMAIFNNMKG